MTGTDLTATTSAEISTELADLATEAINLAAQARSIRTRTEYAKDLALFTAFCDRHDLRALPAKPETVALFATDQARTLKPSTVQRRLSAISAAHKAQGVDTPTQTAVVREVVSGIKRAAAAEAANTNDGRVVDQADALTTHKLAQVLAHIGTDRPKDIRDRALLLIGFAGYFRRSEVAAITVERIERTGTGLRVHLPKSKRDQDGRGTWRDINRGNTGADPVVALDAWLTAGNISTGPVFRSVTRHDHIGDNAVSGRAVDQIIRERTTAAGLSGHWSGHSLRRGAATTAATLGADRLEIARAGGWSDNSATVTRYIERAATDVPNLGL